MLNEVTLKRFGPIQDLRWQGLGGINLVIGGNGTGKTFLLKALYCAMRALEGYKRGREPRSASEILAHQLHWTFQANRIGDLVAKGAGDTLSCQLLLDGQEFRFSFGRGAAKQIASLANHVPPRASNSVFLPAKDVLSPHHIILRAMENDKAFGFDDASLDLSRALRHPPAKAAACAAAAAARQSLEALMGGRIEYDEAAAEWQFRQGKHRFPMGVTAEGIKKLAILDILLANRYLSEESIVFIDEPEATLHPTAISKLLDIAAVLAEGGIQFFLASHSYFVVKKLFLLAQQKQMSIPVLAAAPDGCHWQADDLKDGLFSNAITDESVHLYEQYVDLALG